MGASNSVGLKTNLKGERLPRIPQNVLLVWVDANIDGNKPDSEHTLEQLRAIVNRIMVFQNIDDCVRFLDKVRSEKVLIITSGSLGQDLIQRIHPMEQVDAIYIFCGNTVLHEKWTAKWSKIIGIYDRITPICEVLQHAVKQSNEDSIPISFVRSNTQEGIVGDLNRLDPSFMYTQLFKNILLEMEYDNQRKEEFVKICCETYANNPSELRVLEEFKLKYRPNMAIWWYTRECFTYQMLNRALRLLEGDIIIDMGFFIHDLHCQLETLHRDQVSQYHGKPFLLYRGQGLSTGEFAKLKTSRRRLISFNSFLSTSKRQNIALKFAETSAKKENMVGILFMMIIDPNLKATPFADVKNYSYYALEAEVLFSMHTVFRIKSIRALDKQQRLFEVQLILTGAEDPELRQLTDTIEKEVGNSTGWTRLGKLLIRLQQLDKAEELYLTLLDQHPTGSDQGVYYHQLGCIKTNQGDYHQALRYYKKALSIWQTILSPTDSSLATSYSGIGLVYSKMGKYSKALSYYEKDLAICQTTLSANHSDLAVSYNNIGSVYHSMGEYSTALSYYKKSSRYLSKNTSR